MERNELQQMDASSKTRADLMLLTDLFRAANPTANTFSRITKTGQSCSIIPFADNRATFGTIFLSFFLKKIVLVTDVSLSRTSFSKAGGRKYRYKKKQSAGIPYSRGKLGFCGRMCALVAAVAGCFALVALRVRSRSACAHRRSRQVTSGYYCTVQTVRTEETFCSGGGEINNEYTNGLFRLKFPSCVSIVWAFYFFPQNIAGVLNCKRTLSVC